MVLVSCTQRGFKFCHCNQSVKKGSQAHCFSSQDVKNGTEKTMPYVYTVSGTIESWMKTSVANKAF